MKTSIEFLSEVKAKYHLHSDGRLAAKVEISRAAISKLMAGRDFMGEDTAKKVAELLDLDEAYVVACANAERAARANNPSSEKLWERIAAAFMDNKHAVAAVLVLAVTLVPLMDRMSAPSMLPEAFSGAASGASGFLSENIHYAYFGLVAAAFVALLWFAFPRHNPRPEKEPKQAE